MLSTLRTLWRTEPARCVTAATTIIVFAAAKAGVILNTESVAQAVTVIVPIVFGGELVRKHVTPAGKAT